MPGKPEAPSTLSGHAAEIWRSAFASAYDDTCAKREDRDACAASIAWAAVKQMYRKGKDGQWVEKADDGVMSGPISEVVIAEYPTPIEGSFGFEMGQVYQEAYHAALQGECATAPDPEGCAREKAMWAVEQANMTAKAGEPMKQDMDADGMGMSGAGIERREYSTKRREDYAEEDIALPDGSFPIPDKGALKDAIQSFGRAKDKTAVKSHIMRRARKLGATEMLPESWREKSMTSFDPDLIAIRRLEREMEAKYDAEMLAAGKGESPAMRPAQVSSGVWRSLPASLRTVKAMLNVRAYERAYQEAADLALEEGWERISNPGVPEEYLFRRFVDTPDGAILVRSVLVRPVGHGDWYMKELSRGASSSLAVRAAPGEVRYRPFVFGPNPDSVSILRGGPGSGHFGHEGRLGEQGGSMPSGKSSARSNPLDLTDEAYTGWVQDLSQMPLGRLRSMQSVVSAQLRALDEMEKAGKPTREGAALEQQVWEHALGDAVGLKEFPKENTGAFSIPSWLREMQKTANVGIERGGPGSGHFSHEGRPGEVGGSLPGDEFHFGPLNTGRKARNRVKMSYDIAMAAGMDAANKNMREAGRDAWSEEDYNTAVYTFNRLYPDKMEAPTAEDFHEAQRLGPRKHLLLTKELEKKLPPLYSQEGKGKDAIAQVKFFSPLSNWTWYASEFDPSEGLFFGLVEGFEKEFGYFSLDELEGTTGPGGMPAVERDLYWEPQTFAQILGEEGQEITKPENVIDVPRPESELVLPAGETDNDRLRNWNNTVATVAEYGSTYPTAGGPTLEEVEGKVRDMALKGGFSEGDADVLARIAGSNYAKNYMPGDLPRG